MTRKEWSKAYYQKNRERIIAASRKWQKENPEITRRNKRDSEARRRNKNREAYNAYMREYMRKRAAKKRTTSNNPPPTHHAGYMALDA